MTALGILLTIWGSLEILTIVLIVIAWLRNKDID